MRILVLGGGFGGLNAALWLRKKLDHSGHEVMLISDHPFFVFRPSLIWVPFGGRTIESISFPLERTLQKAGVRFIQNRIVQIRPKENRVELQDGRLVDYDFLVIATGAFPDYKKIKGLQGNTSSIYFPDEALKTKEEVRRIKSGAPIVIGVTQGNPSPAMSYEFLFELEEYLKRENIKTSLTYFTYEQELFDHTGEKVTELLKKHMEDKQISYYCNVHVEKVEQGQVFLSNGLSIPYSFSLVLPPYKGSDFIFSSQDLENENGLIPVNRYLQSVQWENIFAVGDTNVISDLKVIKNGRAAELQGLLAAENIYYRLQGEDQQRAYENSFAGLMELGTDGGLFMMKYSLPIFGSSSIAWAADGFVPHMMKIAFEKYYLWKLS